MNQPLLITDPQDPGPAARNAAERWVLPRLRDPRDIYFVRLVVVMSALVIPAGLSFYAWDFSWWAAGAYWAALFALSAGRFTLLLHAVCHRDLFKRQHRLLSAWVPWVLGPFFGQTPNSFYAHHMGMHHPENNLHDDLSCTLRYQRDSLPDFMLYWARFFFAGFPNLLGYLHSRKRDKLVRKLLVGEISWFAMVGVLLALDWRATLVAFVVPMVLIRWFMMCGNWAQHAFVDLADPNNPYKNSTCLINARYNHKAHNDGYHIVHHIHPSLHWSEMSKWFAERLDTFGEQDAIVFSKLGSNQMVWWCLMRKDYGKLADHLVDLPGQPARDRDDKIAWLRARTQREPVEAAAA